MLPPRLVERIDSQNITADTASYFEEVEQTSDAFFIQCRDNDAHVGYAAVNVGKLCAQFSHLVHFVHVLACQEVQSVEVGFVRRYLQGVLCLLHGDDSFVDGTFAFLIHCPMECRSVEKSTAAGKIPLFSLPSDSP